MLALLTLGLASFAQVLLLGYQSRCVNAGKKLQSFFASSAIGLMQCTTLYGLTHGKLGPAQVAVYSLSGACAIVCAILLYEHIHKEKN